MKAKKPTLLAWAVARAVMAACLAAREGVGAAGRARAAAEVEGVEAWDGGRRKIRARSEKKKKRRAPLSPLSPRHPPHLPGHGRIPARRVGDAATGGQLQARIPALRGQAVAGEGGHGGREENENVTGGGGRTQTLPTFARFFLSLSPFCHTAPSRGVKVWRAHADRPPARIHTLGECDPGGQRKKGKRRRPRPTAGLTLARPPSASTPPRWREKERQRKGRGRERRCTHTRGGEESGCSPEDAPTRAAAPGQEGAPANGKW